MAGTRSAKEGNVGMDANKGYEQIRYEVEDGRARITLARPKTHNAMTPLLLEELEHALWEADEDCAVHSVILRGEGASFCSGYDLTSLGGKKRPGYRTGRTHDDDVWLIEQEQSPHSDALGDPQALDRAGSRQLSCRRDRPRPGL